MTAAYLLGIYSFQGAEQTLNQIADALHRGDVAKLSSLFAPQVEVYIGVSPKIYSDTQARYVIQEFFQKNPPRSFTLLHKGRSEDMLYGIGSYVSMQGRWDVSFFTRFQKGRYLIQQLRFESVNN
ncbi:MAG: DUF4783 domain-containing protein [Bacteroidia bacterium]|nr:DUF4783 domain-containing protein [Bacteroidia bacterium]